ncbi:hypothetical protein, partial [Dapis sp. BLCC M229]|uniref:hypothetical protein n=1 Tax=Dapis sp. BLCC M229 TaxID=3400188 RepID=UPI003CEBDCD7
ISCPVASVLYSKGREQGTQKREEGTGNREQGREGGRFKSKKKLKFPVDIYANFYTNDINGHDIKNRLKYRQAKLFTSKRYKSLITKGFRHF